MIRTLGDTVALVNEYKKAQRGLLRERSLRRRDGAHDEEEQRQAANAFRGWAEFEGLIV